MKNCCSYNFKEFSQELQEDPSNLRRISRILKGFSENLLTVLLKEISISVSSPRKISELTPVEIIAEGLIRRSFLRNSRKLLKEMLMEVL